MSTDNSSTTFSGVSGSDDASDDAKEDEHVTLLQLIDLPTLITPCMIWLTSGCTSSSVGLGSQALLLDPVYKDALAPYVNSLSSIVLIGGIIGQLLGGALADWKGRKVGILVMMTLQLLGHAMYLFWSPSPDVLIGLMYVGRFIAGVGGSGCNPITMALAVEGAVNAEARTLRSTFTVMFMSVSLTLVPLWTAILDTCGVPYTLLWRFTFGFVFIPAVFSYIGILRTEDSPEYQAAMAAKLELANASDAAAHVEPTSLSQLSASFTSGAVSQPAQVKLWSPNNLLRLLYGVVIMLVINVVLYGFIMSAPLVSRDTLGLEGFQGTAWGSTLFGAVGIVFMVGSLPLLYHKDTLWIQKAGYVVQTPGLLLMALLVFCGAQFDLKWLEFTGFLLAFMLGFSVATLLTFAYVPTIYPVQIRGLFTAICLCVGVVAAFIASLMTPSLYDHQGAWLLLVCAACLMSILFCQIWFFYMEPAAVIQKGDEAKV
ncbi:MAG: uncharacterized protein KVP18_002638 [Porospora cf. gigantea A]|uniref:uncharacterized protein n=1 Tax=Porospora cf. gigantea A TaxID=2853593 RepID=UPI00355AB194|nr:MAG: hypothetical protein KVP18_002638 [Porospora cf. gigantea A]